MEKLGFFEGREDREIPLEHSDRSKTPIEPYLSDQWFVKMGDRDDGKPGFAQTAMDAVNDGRVKFFPERYAKTYLDWLGEKRDWCISRQLWWGHRIPIWYAQLLRGRAEARRSPAATTWRGGATRRTASGSICGLERSAGRCSLGSRSTRTGSQDPDVLDTWFSSALWPHSTLGWPEQTPELAYYYPTSVLVTSRDIITLWVARMVMTGLYNVGEVPFHHVYIHPKMLDGFGETMSKTQGQRHRSARHHRALRHRRPALRHGRTSPPRTQDSRMPVANVCPHCDTLGAGEARAHVHADAQGDVSEVQEAVPAGRAVAGARSGAADGEAGVGALRDGPQLRQQAVERRPLPAAEPRRLHAGRRCALEELPIEDRWILSRLATTTAAVTEQLEGYHFSEVARTIYDFTWSEFCDWYVEMSKGRLRDADEPAAGAARAGRRAGRDPAAGAADHAVRGRVDLAGAGRGGVRARPAGAGAGGRERGDRAVAGVPGGVAGRGDGGAHGPDAGPGARGARGAQPLQIEARTPLDVFVRCDEAVADDFRALAPFIVVAGRRRPAGVRPGRGQAAAVGDARSIRTSRRTCRCAGLIDVDAETKRLEKQTGREAQAPAGGARQAAERELRRARRRPEVVQQQRRPGGRAGEADSGAGREPARTAAGVIPTPARRGGREPGAPGWDAIHFSTETGPPHGSAS